MSTTPCPTCSGRNRETVGMICQTCGTNYAATEAEQQAVETFRAAWLEADAKGWAGNRVAAGIRAVIASGCLRGES